MSELITNDRQVMSLYQKRGDNFPLGVRDFAGATLVIGVLLSIGAWRMGLVANILSGLLSIIFLLGCASAFIAYPVAQIIYRKSGRPTTEYDRVRREMGKTN